MAKVLLQANNNGIRETYETFTNTNSSTMGVGSILRRISFKKTGFSSTTKDQIFEDLIVVFHRRPLSSHLLSISRTSGVFMGR